MPDTAGMTQMWDQSHRRDLGLEEEADIKSLYKKEACGTVDPIRQSLKDWGGLTDRRHSRSRSLLERGSFECVGNGPFITQALLLVPNSHIISIILGHLVAVYPVISLSQNGDKN